MFFWNCLAFLITSRCSEILNLDWALLLSYYESVDKSFLPQFSSVTQSCPTLCSLMGCSTPGFLVHRQLPELSQIHLHQVSDAIQPSHPLWSPFPPAFNLFPASGSFLMSQFFISGGQNIGASASATVLPVNIQDWYSLGLTGLILLSKWFSRVFSNTTVQKHQFLGTRPSLWFNSDIHTGLLKKTTALTMWT